MKARPPHVWIVNQYALPRGSTGITRHGDLASVIRSHGLEATVIASSFDNFRRTGETVAGDGSLTDHEGVKFAWLETPAYQGNDGRRVRNMVEFYVRSVTSRLARRVGRPDVVIGSSPHLLSGLAGLHLARRYGARFVLELRDVWPEDLVAMDAVKEGGLTHRALLRLARHLESRAERIITVPPKLREHLLARGVPAAKVLDLPNGAFVTDSHEPAEVPETLDAELRACGDAFVVMYMGAHGQANGLSNVLDAAKLLRNEHPNVPVAFVLVGGGQTKQELVRRARDEGLDNVRFHDPVAKCAVLAAAARADALMVHLAPAPTFDVYGRSPNKLFDYLAAGKPVLYSTSDDDTLVDRFGAGLTFRPGEPRALADTALRLARMPIGEREAMARRGREALVGHHDLAVLGTTLARLVKELSLGPQKAPAMMEGRPNS